MAVISLRFSDLGWPVVCPIISRMTHHWANHVDFCLRDDVMISALPGGVRLAQRIDVPARSEIVIEYPCTARQSEAARAFALDQLGKGYDYLGVLFYKWAPRWNDDSRWFCSELCAAALDHAGIITVPKALHRISPGRLMGLMSAT